MKGGVYKIFLAVFGLLFLGLILWLITLKAHAADSLVINEIYSHVSSSTPGDREWIELFDESESSLVLSNYFLTNHYGTKKYLTTDLPCDSFTGGYYICYVGTRWLTDGGDFISLNSDDGEIDRVTYGSSEGSAPVPAAGESISRIPNGQDTGSDSADFQIALLTPGEANRKTVPITYSNDVIINEILPEPADVKENEFIELYNKGSEEVDLSGWRLDDAASGSEYTIPMNTVIPAGGYLAFYRLITGIALNDTTAESVFLIDPNGDLKDSIHYDQAKRGESFCRFDLGQWSTSPTPGKVNILTVEATLAETDPTVPEVTIAQAKTLSDESPASTTGTVSVAPGTLSTQYFYIQDDSGGLQIYNYDKDFPTLRPGDVVKVTGEMTTYQNERRLKTFSASDITIIGSRPPPEPIDLTIDELNDNFSGRYISVTGTVSKTSGDTFYIHGSGEIKIVIRSNTGINKPRMSVGDRVTVAGIYSNSSSGYRILPTVQDDVRIIGRSGKLPDSGSDTMIIFIISLTLTFSAKTITQFRRH